MCFIPTTTCDRDRARDKALLIGLEYDATVGHLSTPHRDVVLLKEFLVSHEGYLEKNVTVLTDAPGEQSLRPTEARAKIETAIEDFMADVKPGDRRVFFFAGHGYQIVSRTGTEDDNMDEVLLVDPSYGAPLDADQNPLDPCALEESHPDRSKLKGIITDNYLRERLVDRLPAGAQLVAIFDTCHSGTMLDLDYYWTWQHVRCRSHTRSRSAYVIDGVIAQSHTSSLRSPAKMSSVLLEVKARTRYAAQWAAIRAYGRFICNAKRQGRKHVAITLTPPTLSPISDHSLFVPWVQASTAEEQLQCASPVQLEMPRRPVPNVLSISSAMDSQRAWGKEHTMLSVLVDTLRGFNGQRPKVRKLMEDLQVKTTQLRIAALSNNPKGRSKKALAKAKALQCHQFGSLSPTASENDFEL